MFLNQDVDVVHPVIITMSGKARNGKDFTADLLKKAFEDRGKRVIIAHYADELKFMCKQFYGWNGEKDTAGRALLQYVGTEVYRSQDMHFWVKRLISTFDNLRPSDSLEVGEFKWRSPEVIIVPDTRFPNEILGWVACGYTVVPLSVLRSDVIQTDPVNGPCVAPGTMSQLLQYMKEKKAALTPFQNDLSDTAKRHASETALDPYVFNVDGHGLNQNIRMVNPDIGSGAKSMVVTTDLEKDEQLAYLRTSAMYLRMENEKQFENSQWRTSELTTIPFSDHLNAIFKNFVERNMLIVTNVTNIPEVVRNDVKAIADSVCNDILAKRTFG